MGAHTSECNSAVISFNTTGDNTVISSPSSGPIRVHGIWFTVDAATLITFKGGNGSSAAAISGAFDLTAPGSSQTLQINDEPYFYCAPGVNFIMNQSGTANVRGTVYYTAGG